MPQSGLIGSRVVVERLYAILPPEGVPESVIPGWHGCSARILTAPAMGAGFVQYQFDLQLGGGTDATLKPGVEAYFHVLSGTATIAVAAETMTLDAGGYVYVPVGADYRIRAEGEARILGIKKAYEPAGFEPPGTRFGHERDVVGKPFLEVDELLLKTLLPEDPAFDMAMNIFTFPPGFCLPMTETHVMEHGLVMLAGQGLYLLGDRWHEVRAGDFIWMGPYCPQSFYATSSSPARYIYYKNVNRDVEPRPRL